MLRHQIPEQRQGDWIGARLRRVYSDVQAEPLPDGLLDLLREIEGQESAAPARRPSRKVDR